MECPLRGNIECNKLKYKRDELYCSSIDKYLKDMYHNECDGADEFTTKDLGTVCPRCRRLIPLGQNLCETCGFDLEDLK